MFRHALILTAICLLTFFAGLGRSAIGDSDEAFYAESAREMIEQGDWITPHYNYEYRFQKPVLFYWYDPQYLNAQYDLVQVQLPKRFAGCQDDEKKGGDPKKYACAYPSYRLDKLVSSDFLKSGSPSLKVIRNFKWTSADQNFVANLISGKKMSKDKAAAQWVKANGKKVNLWLR